MSDAGNKNIDADGTQYYVDPSKLPMDLALQYYGQLLDEKDKKIEELEAKLADAYALGYVEGREDKAHDASVDNANPQ